MLTEKHISFFKSYGVLLARILLGGFFVLAGINKLTSAESTASYMASAGFPESVALAYLVGLFEVLAGAAIIFGKYMAEAALLLAVFVLVISFPFHGPSLWEENAMQQTLFTKNMAILAGLLYMIAYSNSGSPEERSPDPVPSL